MLLLRVVNISSNWAKKYYIGVVKQTFLMHIFQTSLDITPKTRGFHLITSDVIRSLPEIAAIKTGICQVFIQHTSASLTIN